MTEPPTKTTPFDKLLGEARDHLAGLRQLVRDSRKIVEDGGEIVDPLFFSETIAGGLTRARARVCALEICAEEWRADESADAADTADEDRAAVAYWTSQLPAMRAAGRDARDRELLAEFARRLAEGRRE